jgi:acyl carrier protein
MKAITHETVRDFIENYLTRKLKAEGRELPSDFSENCDLFLSGLLDSLGVVELTTALCTHHDHEIDFEELDPRDMTVVGPLCRFVSEQLVKASLARTA